MLDKEVLRLAVKKGTHGIRERGNIETRKWVDVPKIAGPNDMGFYLYVGMYVCMYIIFYEKKLN